MELNWYQNHKYPTNKPKTTILAHYFLTPPWCLNSHRIYNNLFLFTKCFWDDPQLNTLNIHTKYYDIRCILSKLFKKRSRGQKFLCWVYMFVFVLKLAKTLSEIASFWCPAQTCQHDTEWQSLEVIVDRPCMPLIYAERL